MTNVRLGRVGLSTGKDHDYLGFSEADGSEKLDHVGPGRERA